jgi:hypothetical protein
LAWERKPFFCAEAPAQVKRIRLSGLALMLALCVFLITLI